MLDPLALLDHAFGLLNGVPSEANHRRAISAAYYALFHLLTVAGARTLAAGLPPPVQARVRRTAQHTPMPRLCEMITSAGPTAPNGFSGLLTPPLAQELINVANAFSIMQDARHIADYDLDAPLPRSEAKRLCDLTRQAFQGWSTIAAEPNTQVFLTALLLSERWTRRG